jgi:hypothetical protein
MMLCESEYIPVETWTLTITFSDWDWGHLIIALVLSKISTQCVFP